MTMTISFTGGTEVQMDRDVEFFRTAIWAKSLLSKYPDPLTACIDLYYRFRWGLFSKIPKSNFTKSKFRNLII